MSSGTYFFIWGLNEIVSFQHVIIRTGQIHYMQQNAMGNFGPVTAEHPAQCYNIMMPFKLRQKIN